MGKANLTYEDHKETLQDIITSIEAWFEHGQWCTDANRTIPHSVGRIIQHYAHIFFSVPEGKLIDMDSLLQMARAELETAQKAFQDYSWLIG